MHAFDYIGFKADLQSSKLMEMANEIFPLNILIKWTEYTTTSVGNQPTLSDFQIGLKYRPKYTTKSTVKLIICRLIVGTISDKTVTTLAELTTTLIKGAVRL